MNEQIESQNSVFANTQYATLYATLV